MPKFTEHAKHALIVAGIATVTVAVLHLLSKSKVPVLGALAAKISG